MEHTESHSTYTWVCVSRRRELDHNQTASSNGLFSRRGIAPALARFIDYSFFFDDSSLAIAHVYRPLSRRLRELLAERDEGKGSNRTKENR